MTDEPLRLKQRVTLRYRFAAGRYASRFFAGLREGRVLASLDGGGRALLPPRPVSGLDDAPTTGWAEVGPTATLAGFTVVYVPFIDPMTGEQRPVPYGFGLVRFDGATTNIYHLVDETDPARLHIGLPLEPVWREPSERVGSLADIVCCVRWRIYWTARKAVERATVEAAVSGGEATRARAEVLRECRSLRRRCLLADANPARSGRSPLGR